MTEHLEVLLSGIMTKKFGLRICSDLDHEEIVVDVCWDHTTIATVNQDYGLDNLEIELFPPPKDIESWKFPYEDFVRILEFAKKKLIEMQKLPEPEEDSEEEKGEI